MKKKQQQSEGYKKLVLLISFLGKCSPWEKIEVQSAVKFYKIYTIIQHCKVALHQIEFKFAKSNIVLKSFLIHTQIRITKVKEFITDAINNNESSSNIQFLRFNYFRFNSFRIFGLKVTLFFKWHTSTRIYINKFFLPLSFFCMNPCRRKETP